MLGKLLTTKAILRDGFRVRLVNRRRVIRGKGGIEEGENLVGGISGEHGCTLPRERSLPTRIVRKESKKEKTPLLSGVSSRERRQPWQTAPVGKRTTSCARTYREPCGRAPSA